MKKYLKTLVIFAILFGGVSAQAETFRAGDAVEFVQDVTCFDYSTMRGDESVPGDNCDTSQYFFYGKSGIVVGGPRINNVGKTEWQIDYGYIDYSYAYSPTYGKNVPGWFMESIIRKPASSQQKVSSLEVSSSLSKIRMNSTLPKVTAKILDANGQPVRGYINKWRYSAPEGTRCSLVGYGPSGQTPVLGESTIYPYCVDYSLNVSSPAKTITFIAESGGKTASTTVYLSYLGDKGPESRDTSTTVNENSGTLPRGCLPGYNYSPVTGERCEASRSTRTQSGDSDPARNASLSAGVSVNSDPEAPLVNMSINPGSLRQAGTAIISWTSQRSQSCTSDAWEGIKGSSGSATINPVRTRAYSVTCTNNLGKSSTARATVTIGVTGDGAGSGGGDDSDNDPGNNSAGHFAIGNSVAVRSEGVLNVRSTPGGAILGTQQPGATGIITEGPRTAGGYTWWRINYATGADGWSAENYLEITNSNGESASRLTTDGGGWNTENYLRVIRSGLTVPQELASADIYDPIAFATAYAKPLNSGDATPAQAQAYAVSKGGSLAPNLAWFEWNAEIIYGMSNDDLPSESEKNAIITSLISTWRLNVKIAWESQHAYMVFPSGFRGNVYLISASDLNSKPFCFGTVNCELPR